MDNSQYVLHSMVPEMKSNNIYEVYELLEITTNRSRLT